MLTHGANPGLVSHLVKQALLNIASDAEAGASTEPTSREDWAQLARKPRHQGRCTSPSATRRSSIVPKEPNEFVNTWSVDGFVSEGAAAGGAGLGHAREELPARRRAGTTSVAAAAIYLTQPGAATRVRTWTPRAGHFHGFLITHGEAISISDYYTVREGGQVVYRPTAHYAYHPCDAAVVSVHEFAGPQLDPAGQQADPDGRHRQGRR